MQCDDWNIADTQAREEIEFTIALLLCHSREAWPEEADYDHEFGGTIRYLNPAFEMMTGYSKDEALGNESKDFEKW